MGDTLLLQRWLDPNAAAKHMNCSKSLLDKDRISGLLGIPFSRIGRKIVYDRQELDDYLERRKVRMNAPEGV